MTSTPIVDPRGVDPESSGFAGTPRRDSLKGARIGVLDNGKPNAIHVVGLPGRTLAERNDAELLAVTKPIASIPAEEDVILRSMRELGAAIFLFTSNTRVLSVVIFDLWFSGVLARAAAVSLIYAGLLLVIVMFARRYLGVQGPK